MQKKPSYSFWQIWNMCFGFLGIQFGFALQNANVSRIFQTLGASMEAIPLLWIAAPVTGLLVQPIIGYFSDHTWTRMGRRRPYFFWGAVFSTLALLVMPNSPALWVAAITLWILDASINVSMEPFRAFVGDMLSPEQRARGYAMQSFFIGVGAVVASALPWLLSNIFGVANEAPEGVVPDSVVFSFYIGGVVFLLAILWTVWRTKEYTPEQLKAYEAAEKVNATSEQLSSLTPAASLSENAALWLAGGILLLLLVWWRELDQQLYILGSACVLFALLKYFAHFLSRVETNPSKNMLVAIMTDMSMMPATMRKLAWVQFFTWFALFSMWIYTTPAVTANHFGSSDPASAIYNQGANWVGILFATYNGVAALLALLLPVLAKRIGYVMTHTLCLFAGALGLLSFLLIDDPDWLLLSMVGIGISWASILSMPYAILSNALPAEKMGIYMGIFNFFIVIPQLLAASVLGSLLHWFFNSEPIYALLLGAVSFILSAVLMVRIRQHVMPVKIQSSVV